MQREERKNSITNKSSKCRYCGTLINISLCNYIYDNVDLYNKNDLLKYINAMICIPNKNSTSAQRSFLKCDRRVFEHSNPLEVKDITMIRSPILSYNKKANRVRYTPKVKYKTKFPLEEAIFICKCTKSTAIHPIHAMNSYSERIGYNQILTGIRQYIVNYMTRR